LEFRLLGSVEVVDDCDEKVDLGGATQRAVLALLVLNDGATISTARLVDEVWGEAAPATAVKTLQAYISRLRRALSDEVIVSKQGGYALEAGGASIDVREFERLSEEARAAEPERAAELLRQALALWRGDALAGLTAPFALREARRLEELKLGALEERVDAELALGRHEALVPELTALTDEHPLRERLQGQLMVALYRSNRQADALEAYQRARRRLVDELGIEPGSGLRDLERRILRHDPVMLVAQPSPPAPDPEPSQQRPRRLQWIAVAVVAIAVAAATGVLIAHDGGPEPASAKPDSTPRAALVVRNARLRPSIAHVALPVDGLRRAGRTLGVRTSIVDGGKSDASYAAALERAARSADIVIAGEQLLAEEAVTVARRFPQVRFVLLGNSVNELKSRPANVTGVIFDNRELGYLAGYLAGLEARRGTHGFVVSAVGGAPIPAVAALAAGYHQGARAAHPGIKVLIDYADSFVDQSRCENIANNQIDAGSRVVFDIAGACGEGALSAAGIRGVWGIGVDSDHSYLGPHVLASAVVRFDSATLLAVREFVEGQLPRAGDIQLGLTQDGIGLVGLSTQLSQSVRTRLERQAAAIRAHGMS
jgi:basic membrane lipoprotein Med (substrate-binding protein (PBP1-ABC) superfamily)/DNA-binding SARP family transcriptional activator